MGNNVADRGLIIIDKSRSVVRRIATPVSTTAWEVSFRRYGHQSPRVQAMG